MKLSMKYGTERLDLRVKDSLVARHISFAERSTGERSARAEVEKSVEELRTSGFFFAARDRVVGVLLADSTRERTFDVILPLLADALRSARELRVFVCTGTHDPNSTENRELGNDLRERLQQLSITATVTVHDPASPELVHVGTTANGTRVEVEAAALACETFLVLANMKVHYFAGYSNPVKYYLPGLCSYETARGNHALTLDERSTFSRHPWHPRPECRDNPLAADMVEGFELLIGERKHFALAVVGTIEEPVWCGGGRTEEVSARAMEVVDRVTRLEVEPSRFLVVSPGGHPHDESLYTAQRALELTRAAVLDGGEVLFLAACPYGIGTEVARRNFYEPLTRPLAEVCRKPVGEYVMYSHKAYKFGLYLAGLSRVHIVSSLPDEEVAAMHLTLAGSAQAVLDDWADRAQPGDVVTFVDDASKFALARRS